MTIGLSPTRWPPNNERATNSKPISAKPNLKPTSARPNLKPIGAKPTNSKATTRQRFNQITRRLHPQSEGTRFVTNETGGRFWPPTIFADRRIVYYMLPYLIGQCQAVHGHVNVTTLATTLPQNTGTSSGKQSDGARVGQPPSTTTREHCEPTSSGCPV
jgi:hypothetical protein